MISEKIVVIDDDPRIIKSMRIGLNEFEIVDFQRGEEALAYLRKPNNVNIILLDYMMPELDGISVLSEIRSFMKDVSVILVTGHGTKDVMLEALRNHADDFVEKPVQMSKLKEKVNNLLRQKLYTKDFHRDKENQIERIKHYVKRNDCKVSLQDIADEMSLNPKYISRIFNAKNDLSFRDFKLQIKIDRAKELLCSTHLDVAEISLELGYQNAESFMRIFKRLTNQTPTEYRKENC